MKKHILVLGLCCCMVYLSGCATIPPTHYYTFRPDFQQVSENPDSTYPFILGIAAFDADLPYQQDKIVFRTSPYEVDFYEYHRWLRVPQDLVTEQVVKVAAASGLFQKVHPYAFEAYSDYILHGTIKMFDQWYSDEETSSIQVTLQYRLISPDDERILWTGVFHTTVELTELSVVEAVKKFETALHNNILQALAAIENVLQRQQ